MKKTIFILLSFFLGLVFIISGISKLFPIEPFEYQFVDIGVASWNTAPYMARFFIGIELFLGTMLLLNIALRRFTLKFTVILLTLFTFYLLFKIVTEGNTGNCGCFGEAIQMSPLQGILKNLLLLLSSFVLYTLAEYEYWNSFWRKLLATILLAGSMAIGFFVFPIDLVYTSTLDKNHINYKVPLELMYTEKQKEKPKIELRKGKHIIAFLSLTCSHCRIAAKKIHVMQKKNLSIPFYLAINGDQEMVKDFFDDTHTQNIPHNLFLGPNEWTRVAGISLPIIMYINNGIVVKKCNGTDLNQRDIEAWLIK